jgi:hypothetical protein
MLEPLHVHVLFWSSVKVLPDVVPNFLELDNVNVAVAPHTSALTVRATNITSKRRRDIDKVRNLREEEDFSVGGGVFARRALDKEID